MTNVFSTCQVERLTGLHVRRLERLAREGILRPAVVRRGRRKFLCWGWTDLVEARVLAALDAAGASGRTIRAAALALRELTPDRPLAACTLRVTAGDIVVLEPAGELAWSLVRRRGQGLALALAPLEAEMKDRLAAGAAEVRRLEVADEQTRRKVGGE